MGVGDRNVCVLKIGIYVCILKKGIYVCWRKEYAHVR